MGNAISGGFTGGDTYTIDNTPPVVSSITATGASPTNATSVGYTVTFSEGVTGVDNTDFTATVSGVTTTGITVTPVSSSVYTVTVNGISGNGTLRLDLNSSGTGIADLVGNAISGGFTGGDIYTIDNTPPVVSSITATGTSPTNATSVAYTVTFSEAVTGVDNTDFTATVSGVTTTGITVTPVSGSTYTVTVNGVSGNGTVRLDLNSSGTGIADLVGNAISGGFTGGDTYTIDQTAPTVVSIAATDPVQTNETSLDYQITFNEPVTGVDASDFTATTSGVGAGTISVSPVSATIYNITINTVSGNGTLRLDLNSSGTGIADLAGNAISGGVPGGDTYNVDQTLPAATISAPSVTSIGNSGSGLVTYTVTYADANFSTSNLTGAGITLIPTGTATGTVAVSGSGTSYTVTISGITGLGTLGISVGAGFANDLAGNTDLGAGPSATFTVLSSNAALSLIALNPYSTLTNTGTVGSTTTYTTTASNATTSVTITPTTADATATVKVNGVTVISGTASISQPLNVGANTIPVVVTAQDGTTTRTYSITVTRAQSPNARLTSIVLSPFSSLVNTAGTTYTTSVGNATSSVTVTPTTSDATATVKVNGVTVASGTASASQPLSVGANTIPVVVTAQNGTTLTYSVIVTRAPSSNARLTSIVLSPFSSLVNTTGTTYTTSVGNSTSSVTVTPTTSDATATVKVNGVTVTSGTASVSQPLTAGTNTIPVVVTAQDGTTLTYSVVITRAPSSDARLTSIVLNPYSQLVNTTGTTYTTSVGNATTSVTITPTTHDPTATVKVNGATVTSGTPSASQSLAVGPNTIPVVVTAQDGTILSYSVIITRAQSSNAQLSSVALNPYSQLTFTRATNTYTTSVSNATTSVTVTPTTNDPTATVKVNGVTVTSGTPSAGQSLAVGANTIPVVVTAQDGTIISYSVIITRAQSSNAQLSSVALNPYSQLTFTRATNTYTTSVSNATISVTVTPTTNDPTATVKVNGVTVTSGTPSASQSLAVGQNTIPVVVTAQDGTIISYSVTITRAQSSNAQLSSVALNPYSQLTFTRATNTYTTSVSNATTSVTVTPTTNDPTATVKVNGVTVTSGTPSAGQSLAVGANTIPVVVTAQDGTILSYSVIITRAQSSNAQLSSVSLNPYSELIFTRATTTYTTSVSNATTSVTVTPTTDDPTATIKVNGITVISGTASSSQPLAVGTNTIPIVVTAQDGTILSYSVIITRAQSSDARLSTIVLNPYSQLVYSPGITTYSTSVSNATTSVTVTPTTDDPTARVKVNGVAVTSGTASASQPLSVGTNNIPMVVTAQDGTILNYTLTITRASGPLMSLHQPIQQISVTKPADTVLIENDGIMVHQGVSPNGDGINDFLTIDGINQYPDNRLTIIDRNGSLIYQAKGYDNSSKAFDGHSNINGKLLQSGTYFYSLDYSVNGQNKHKTGFILLKY